MLDFEGAQVVQRGREGARLRVELVLGLGLARDSLVEHAEEILGLGLVQVTRIALGGREVDWVLWETQAMFGMSFQEVKREKGDERG